MAGFHKITSMNHVDVSEPKWHTHIEVTETSEPNARRWTVPEIYAAIDAGDSFYFEFARGSVCATVAKQACEYCGQDTIGSPLHERFDDLPHCPVSAIEDHANAVAVGVA